MAVQKQKATHRCLSCNRDLVINQANFYYHNNSNYIMDKDIKVFPMCKECIESYLNVEPEKLKNRAIDLLRLINRPFIEKQWILADEKWGKYIKYISSLNNGKKTFDESVFENSTMNAVTIDGDPDLIQKWGGGYSAIEYENFERKYNNLKNNYQEKTAMHTEALLTYIRYRVKEELATAKGDSKAAKEWGNLAKDAATAAKINPSQFTKADLTNGMDSFGELVRSVESTVDVIDILPRFKQRANDKVDFTIWCYINYVRDLQGMPSVEYEEIYKFLEQRTREFEDNLLDYDEGDLAD